MLLNGTPIAISATETKLVQDLLVGDTVLAAGLTRDWKAATVRFSTGAPPGGRFTAIRLQMDGGRELIGSMTQFVLTDRGLMEMKKITQGDQLIGADGQGVEVAAMTVGIFGQGNHIVATTPQPTTDPTGHLLLAQGFIVADYALSMGLAGSEEEADSALPPA